MTILDQHTAAPDTPSATSTIPVPTSAQHEALRHRLQTAKHAYSTRMLGPHLRGAEGLHLVSGEHRPRAGEMVLARIESIGQHRRIEGPGSRRGHLFVGDEIVVAYGSRYAADQFHALLPEDLGSCHLAAAGGLASRVVESHAAIDEPTAITPIGVLADSSGPITTQRLALHQVHTDAADAAAAGRGASRTVPVIVVLGTSMNSGKTTVLAHLAHGLAAAGLRVAAGKATGTGAGNDAHLFRDAGAHRVLDFTDFGFPSTYGLDARSIRDLFLALTEELATPAAEGAPDVVLVEIADGVFQGETARLLTDPLFTAVADRVVLAAGDALGAAGGVQVLGTLGVEPAAVSGLVTASPLATAEARRAVDMPVVPTLDLGLAAGAMELAGDLLPR